MSAINSLSLFDQDTAERFLKTGLPQHNVAERMSQLNIKAEIQEAVLAAAYWEKAEAESVDSEGSSAIEDESDMESSDSSERSYEVCAGQGDGASIDENIKSHLPWPGAEFIEATSLLDEEEQAENVSQWEDEESNLWKTTEYGTPRTLQEASISAAMIRRSLRKKNCGSMRHSPLAILYVLMVGSGVIFCSTLLIGGRSKENTSPMSSRGAPVMALDPITTFDCDFDTAIQPHVIDQCRCTGSIDILSEDIRKRYQSHVENFIPLLYANYDESISSCSVRNQALVWLSSGNDHEFSNAERSERFAMASLFVGLKGENWEDGSGWLSEAPICDWYGVTCDEDGNAESVSLVSNNLSGRIPREILSLQQLSLFSLSRNSITGKIPPEIFFVPTLQGLYLNNNQLSGSIPAAIREASSLEIFEVQSNTLEGRIPEELAGAKNLVTVKVADNKLSGNLPQVIFSLDRLEDLELQSNRLGGSIPDSIQYASSLRVLDMSSNLFLGTLPDALGGAVNLETLKLQKLGIVGTLPDVFQRLTNLLEVTIVRTEIEGKLPTSLLSLPKLATLTLAENRIDDVIDSRFGGLTSLQTLDLSGNFISGSLDVPFDNMTRLAELHLNDNRLTGELPSSLGGIPSLASIRLDGNELQGEVPDQVCTLRERNLQELVVDCVATDCAVPKCCSSCRE